MISFSFRFLRMRGNIQCNKEGKQIVEFTHFLISPLKQPFCELGLSVTKQFQIVLQYCAVTFVHIFTAAKA